MNFSKIVLLIDHRTENPCKIILSKVTLSTCINGQLIKRFSTLWTIGEIIDITVNWKNTFDEKNDIQMNIVIEQTSSIDGLQQIHPVDHFTEHDLINENQFEKWFDEEDLRVFHLNSSLDLEYEKNIISSQWKEQQFTDSMW